MSIQAHIDSLAKKRIQLKQQIAEESAHPAPNFSLITDLKKQKLQLKQEMQGYFSALKQDSAATS